MSKIFSYHFLDVIIIIFLIVILVISDILDVILSSFPVITWFVVCRGPRGPGCDRQRASIQMYLAEKISGNQIRRGSWGRHEMVHIYCYIIVYMCVYIIIYILGIYYIILYNYNT